MSTRCQFTLVNIYVWYWNIHPDLFRGLVINCRLTNAEGLKRYLSLELFVSFLLQNFFFLVSYPTVAYINSKAFSLFHINLCQVDSLVTSLIVRLSVCSKRYSYSPKKCAWACFGLSKKSCCVCQSCRSSFYLAK